MTRLGKLALWLSSAVAGAACTTDVSSVASLGTQGRLLGGVPLHGNTSALPHAIAAGANGVYYATYPFIAYCPLSGCLDGPVVYYDAISLGQVALTVADAQNVYWTEFVAVPPHMWLRSAPQGVASVSSATTLYDGFGQTVASNVGSAPSLGFLAQDGGTLYWTTNPGPDMPTKTKLSWCPTTGCTNAQSVDLPEYSTVLAVKGSTIYLARPEASGSVLAACNTAGSCKDLVGSPYVVLEAPASIDGGNLYFQADDRRSGYGLYACALPTCDGGPKLVCPTPVAQQVVSAGVVYASAAGNPPGFGECGVGSCSTGPRRIDLPFGPVATFTEVGAPSAIVAAPMGGAYAYSALMPPAGNSALSGLNDPFALVYLPPPSP